MASPNISFDTIPSSIRKPGVYTEINTSLAVRALPANAQPTVIVAQRTASGSIAANTVATVFSDADASLYFGAGSTAHRMAKAALDANLYQLQIPNVLHQTETFLLMLSRLILQITLIGITIYLWTCLLLFSTYTILI